MGREVELTDHGWGHIMERHADDLAGHEAEVRLTGAAPDRINIDADHARREIYYRAFGTGRRMLRVVVNYRPVPPQGTWVGDVVTAHPTFRHKRGEQHRWP